MIKVLPCKKAPSLDIITGVLLQATWEVQAFKKVLFTLLIDFIPRRLPFQGLEGRYSKSPKEQEQL